MTFFSDLDQRLALLREALGGDLHPEQLPVVLDRLDDDDIVAVIAAATEYVRAGEKVRIAAAGVAAARSAREAGHDG
ncbi:MAG TPA: HNH endonuclease, partial [Agromyces sp.]